MSSSGLVILIFSGFAVVALVISSAFGLLSAKIEIDVNLKAMKTVQALNTLGLALLLFALLIVVYGGLA